LCCQRDDRVDGKQNKVFLSTIKQRCGMPEEEPPAAVDPGEEEKLFHERYLAAVNNPLRKR
jgi:hypothetical protein